MADITRIEDEVSVTSIIKGEVRLYISSDGGTTWYPVRADSDGHPQIDVLSLPSLPAGANEIGSVKDAGSGKTLKTAVIDLTTTGDVISAVTGKVIKVYAAKIICSEALEINFASYNAGTSTTTNLEGGQSYAANGGFAMAVNPPAYLFKTLIGESLRLVITGTGTAAGFVSYWDDDAS